MSKCLRCPCLQDAHCQVLVETPVRKQAGATERPVQGAQGTPAPRGPRGRLCSRGEPFISVPLHRELSAAADKEGGYE